MTKKNIVFCMTSDFAFDQRMRRVVDTLTKDNIGIVIHRSKKRFALSLPIKIIDLQTRQKKGILFYLIFNIKLFFKLWKINADIVYTVDTDTLLATGMYHWIKKKINIFDSHEYFTEVPELKNKHTKKKIWSMIEKAFVPKADLCLTVGPILAGIFSKNFAKTFYPIRNVPYEIKKINSIQKEKLIIYQGAINEGRGLHCAIDAMSYLDGFKLLIIGDGDIKNELKLYLKDKPYRFQVEMKDAMLPADLEVWTSKAMFGLNLIENTSLNYYYSLANKFFDYLQSGVPSVNMRFPEYENILNEKPFGLMINELNAILLAETILTNSNELSYKQLIDNCQKYKAEFTWEEEEQKLLSHFHSLIH